MQNNLRPVVLFGILFLSVTLFMFGLGGQFLWEYSEARRNGYADDSDWWAGAFITAFAAMLLVLVLGVMVGKQWARVGLIFLFGVSLAAWSLIIAITFRDAARTWLVTGGIGIFVYGLLIFGLLAAGNRYVTGQHPPEDDWPDLLDR